VDYMLELIMENTHFHAARKNTKTPLGKKKTKRDEKITCCQSQN